jgi:hypothetical protein
MNFGMALQQLAISKYSRYIDDLAMPCMFIFHNVE